ncbi:MAG: hypothetical protein JO215_06680 [Ktedonobacteraceae bacterium]|nr:hypothetical protein [Ktedonobacteraceae bacterium]
MLLDPQPRYQIPTHLMTPDKIDLPLFGITVSLTMRQGVCYLLGGSAVFHLWQESLGLVGIFGLLVHWGGPLLLAFLTYVIAVHEFRGRHLEAWALIGLHYRVRPKVFVWRSVLGEHSVPSTECSEDAQTNGVNDFDEEGEEG